MIGPAWQEFFPLERCRPEQAEALGFIFSCLNDATDIFLEAPTGIGKSAVAETVALYLEAHSQRTYISTTTVDLEDQYVRDFRDFGLRQLHSSVHYKCKTWGNCDIGSCSMISHPDPYEPMAPIGPQQRCQKEDCPYQIAKAEFAAAAVGIANSAYLITAARFVAGFPQRSLLIVDEAHKFHEQIASSYGFTVTRNEITTINNGFPEKGSETIWLRDVYLRYITDALAWAEAHFESLTKDEDSHVIKKARDAVRLFVTKRANLATILNTLPAEWIFDSSGGGQINILPVWATRFAPGLLRRLGQKRLYMSATLPDFGRQARWLGVDPNAATSRFLSLPSPFPEENRLIYCHPVVRWDRDRPEASCKIAAGELTRILERHPTQRGLVHISSYRQAEMIVDFCQSPRLITHSDSASRAEVLEALYATPGAVLISPSSKEGLDLYGDRSEFQVILKLPYASLGDERVRRRMDDDDGWYGLITAQQLVQAAGRSVRSSTDCAATYILDSRWPWFVRNNKRFLPEYFIKAIRPMPKGAVS